MIKLTLPGAVGVTLAAVLLLSLLAVAAVAQTSSPFVAFPNQSAIIVLTDSGISISPSSLNPGPTMFEVRNGSSEARGVYVTGDDRTGNPLIRYSSEIMPGETIHMSFWLYQGNSYRFSDYTSRSVVNDKTSFVSTYSTDMSIPVRVTMAQWPRYNRQKGTIRITEDGIRINPETTVLGPIEFTVTNDTNKARGIVIAGQDRSGSQIFRHSPIITPGHSTTMSFWLYEGRDYSVMDYSGRYLPAAGRDFGSSFRSALSVAPGKPAGYGAGPMNPDASDE